MNTAQDIYDMWSNSMRDVRSNYHLTLGELIDCLTTAEPEGLVVFDTGGFVGNENSYRGYYSDLAFDESDEEKTVGELLKRCESAIGQTYEGYKGGDYIMNDNTPLWFSNWGHVSNIAIMNAEISVGGNDVILTTKHISK